MKANESAKQAVAVWTSQYQRLKEQTHNFTFDLFLDDAFRLGLRGMAKHEIDFFMATQPADDLEEEEVDIEDLVKHGKRVPRAKSGKI